MTIDEIYELVSANIVNNIPVENWEYAKLSIEGDDDYVELHGKFVTDGKECQIDVHNFDGDVSFALMELHEITTEGGNNKWNRAVFLLKPNGKFDMEFIWDQELDNELKKLSK